MRLQKRFAGLPKRRQFRSKMEFNLRYENGISQSRVSRNERG